MANLRPIAIVLALSLTSSAALAQNCGLRNSVRVVHSLCSGDGASESAVDTGFVAAGPLTSSFGINPTNACGCHSEFAVMMTSDYGSLSYNASASGNSCACCGIFVWFDDGAGQAGRNRFFDRLTIESASLPAGTPVTIRATLHVLGGVSASNASTERSFGGQLDITSPISRSLAINDAQGSTSDQFTLGVGQAFNINCQLFSILRDYVLMNFNQTGSIGANVNVVATFEVLTPAASLSSCSGHNYAPQTFCPVDLDNGSGAGSPDGAVTIDDLLYFLMGFESGNVAVDLDNGSGTGTHDGAVDINDLLFFLVHFESGC